MKWWEVELNFKVRGSSKNIDLSGDGFAFWLVATLSSLGLARILLLNITVLFEVLKILQCMVLPPAAPVCPQRKMLIFSFLI